MTKTRNNWVCVIEFPDGSQGLLRRLGRIILKRTQRVWAKITDRLGFYVPLGEYDRSRERDSPEPMCIETNGNEKGVNFRALVSTYFKLSFPSMPAKPA